MNTSTDYRENIPDLAVPISEKEHAFGRADAPITIVEYGDYECPDCFNAQPVVSQLRERLGDRLRFIFRHFPQSSIHPRASAAAQAAEAAGVLGKFWEMHNLLFRHQRELANLDLIHLGLQVGLDVYRFQQEIESDIHAQRIRNDYNGGVRSGVHGTPTFFINDRRYKGPVEASQIIAATSGGTAPK